MQRMEVGQSAVTDVAITAKTVFALWSKAGVTMELSVGCRGTNGLIRGGVAERGGWGVFENPPSKLPSLERNVCVAGLESLSDFK